MKKAAAAAAATRRSNVRRREKITNRFIIFNPNFFLKIKRSKHSSLLDPFMGFKEYEVLWIWVRIHNNSFLAKLMNGSNKLEYLSLKKIQSTVMKHSSLLGQFVSYKENEVL